MDYCVCFYNFDLFDNNCTQKNGLRVGEELPDWIWDWKGFNFGIWKLQISLGLQLSFGCCLEFRMGKAHYIGLQTGGFRRGHPLCAPPLIFAGTGPLTVYGRSIATAFLKKCLCPLYWKFVDRPLAETLLQGKLLNFCLFWCLKVTFWLICVLHPTPLAATLGLRTLGIISILFQSLNKEHNYCW